MLKSSQSSDQERQQDDFFCEDISGYVAELQLHMTLQARNLVPSLPDRKTSEGETDAKTNNLSTHPTSNPQSVNASRVQLLQDTQATMEKSISRQEILSCRL